MWQQTLLVLRLAGMMSLGILWHHRGADRDVQLLQKQANVLSRQNLVKVQGSYNSYVDRQIDIPSSFTMGLNWNVTLITDAKSCHL